MSKLTQIENALIAIDPAEFQRLCDSYLHSRGYECLNPIGVAFGTNKVAKGTPDTLITQPNGDYIFAEYSTQQNGLAGKFERDINKCLDSSKTGIPPTKIIEIILCHNSRLTPEEDFKLRELCLNNGVQLSIYGLGALAHELYQKHPRLAEEFLHIEVDTRQILSPSEFITAYNKNALATPLDINFHFRSGEIAQALASLETGDLLLVSGRAGIGKSRLALECCEQFASRHAEYKTYCIHNKGQDLFQDLQAYLSPPGSYLVFVDDANRTSRFDYVLHFLHEQRSDRRIKIIATVRDYALDAVRKSARPFGGGDLLEVKSLSEEQIKELVSDEFSIKHHLYLERIAEIAKGNPRLAVMAARVAAHENRLDSINDVSALYDEYFASIRQDLADLQSEKLLQVAGIISFFQAVDRSNDELMNTIHQVFGISSEEFWRAANRLHEFEAVDMYEQEVVRVSDQVLSTYLFYLAAFSGQTLDIGKLVENLFPQFRYRLVESLNAVLIAFNGQTIVECLRPHVDRVWTAAQERADEQNLLHLADVFWFVKQTDALLYVRDCIRVLEPEMHAVGKSDFVPSSQTPATPSLLSILDNFRFTDNTTLRMAINLIVEYVKRRPKETSLIMRMLTERYGMRYDSYLRGFDVERIVIEVLWEHARTSEDELISRVLLAVAKPLLYTHSQTHESKSNSSISIIKFDVPVTPELLSLRRVIWQHIFDLHSAPALQRHIVQFIQNHTESGYYVTNRDIIENEVEAVQEFFRNALRPEDFRHCLAVHSGVVA